jgi:acetoin utilization deacetylase AcuC-like enzyme
MTTGFLYDEYCLLHDTGPGHPERPARLRAIREGLERSGLWDTLLHLNVGKAKHEWIEAVHPSQHIATIEGISLSGGGMVDADTVMSAESYDAALLAAGGAVAGCAAVMKGVCDTAFSAMRPPGHHAERDHAMGFCLFNNVAIAARYLQREHGLERIAIFDWDVHHGNGTQHIFEEDPTVLYISTQQHPLYPGTGMSSETGRGAGEGFTLNIPLPAGCGDEEYRAVFPTIEAKIREFSPEFLLISAGFDAHRDDPLANMLVTADGFRWMMRRMLDLAAAECNGRLVAVLEGGYHLEALAQSVGVCIEEMLC